MSWVCERCNAENVDDTVKECQACLQDKVEKRFYKTKPEPETEKGEIFTVRLNREERLILEDIKRVLDISGDSTALKIAALKGWEVLQRTLGRDYLAWIASKDRNSRRLK